MRTSVVLAATLVVAAAGSSASAGVVFAVDGISNNGVISTQQGEGQLSVDVSAGIGGTVIFTVINAGPAPSSIANVYFDDMGLLNTATITNGPGVDFTTGGSPGSLPSGNAVGFITDFRFSARNPAPIKGVNPVEWVAFTFTTNGGADVNTIVNAMNSGGLRIGMHVIAFENGNSESFVTPTPGTAAMLGMAGIAFARRRR